MQHIIILIGSPGAGKGSQAETLKKKLGVAHISTGNLLRENITNGTPLGLAFKKYMDAGLLGPDDLIFSMIFERVKEADCKNGYILDGFPRNLAQAEELQKRLNGHCRTSAILLDVPDNQVITRLTGRSICKDCSSPFHKIFAPPKEAGVCDACSGELYQRNDDKEETVRKRLNVYRDETAPIIDFYRKLGLLHIVDATGTKNSVTENLLSLLRREAEDVAVGIRK